RMTSTIKDYTENLENKVHERTEQLSISNNKLTYYNKEITDSINYAKHIQSSILPDHKTLENSLKEYFILYKPRNIVGGDLYFYKNVNNSQLIAVADCTGHGVPGAFMTLIVSSALNHIVDKYQNPAQILKELNINIRKQLHQHNKTDFLSDDGLDIAICQITANKKSLIYAGAQFPMAYCKNNQVFMLKGDKQNVGYIRSKEDFEYINHEILLEGNEIFYLCSDGLFHQNGTNNRYPFGKKRYTQFLLEHHNLPLSRQKQLIEDLFLIYQGDAPQRDDLVLFGFKIF
ncbi:MAG: SpoIIE family protein phosphatase, partial [Spirochaetota bacterium]|nr:SpoIIE family protein phosphatase [Spirochaetota bacterium]